MALDGTGLIIILLFFIRGYMKGFIVAAFSVLAILLGAMCALRLSGTFGAWLLEHNYTSSAWAPVLSYALLFIAVVLLVRIIARVIEKALQGLMLGMVNKLVGGLLYAFLGAVLWSSCLWIGSRMGIIKPETIVESKTYSGLSALAPWAFEKAGTLLPFVKDTFDKLGHFFDTVNTKPADVGTH